MCSLTKRQKTLDISFTHGSFNRKLAVFINLLLHVGWHSPRSSSCKDNIFTCQKQTLFHNFTFMLQGGRLAKHVGGWEAKQRDK